MRVIINAENLSLKKTFEIMTNLTTVFGELGVPIDKEKVINYPKRIELCNDQEEYILRSKGRISNSDDFEFNIDLNDEEILRFKEFENLKKVTPDDEIKKMTFDDKIKKLDDKIMTLDDETKKIDKKLKKLEYKFLENKLGNEKPRKPFLTNDTCA